MAATYRQINERNRFFGKGNYSNCRNHFVSYKSILNDDEFILRTKNVLSRLLSNDTVVFILPIDNNKFIYLQHWNIHKSAFINDEGKREPTWLVKINKKYFNVKTSKEPFPEVQFNAPDNYDSLFSEAEIQGKAKVKVEMK